MNSTRLARFTVLSSFLVAGAWLGCGGSTAGGGGEPDETDTTGASSSSGGGSSSGGSSSGGSSSGGSSSGDIDAGTPCGNGTLDPNEACDDGNGTDGDGCSATCTVETGWACDADAGSCSPVCGNGTVQSREACDLGANNGTGGCTTTCAIPVGFTCGTDGGAPACGAVCGDGVVAGTETCDDGALNGEPTKCNASCTGTVAAICGDGRIQAGEGCDDGANNGQVGFCAANCPVPTAPLPAQNGTISGLTRGYWFTAPKDFVITSLRVPTDASNGNQSIAVVRLAAAPPLYSGTTNAFETLYLVQNSAQQTAFPVKIPVSNGDIIGVLGLRGSVNSYAPSPYTSNIDGTDVSFARLGFQFDMTTTAPRDLWTENGGSISRVDMTYAKSQCGDGVRVDSEGCDDGNLAAGDGCSATCTVEAAFTCTEGPLGLLTSACTATCGDTQVASTEGCDDGVDNGTAGKCDATCKGFDFDTTDHAATSTAGTHGYWFTAPAAFTIRALRAPTEAGAGDQSFAVVRFTAAPPTNGVTTNAFQTLAYVRGLAGSAYSDVKIAVAAGDRIGVLGGRGAAAAITSSLSGANVSASAGGQSIMLAPLSTTGSLDTAGPGNLRASAVGGPVGRVDVLVGP